MDGIELFLAEYHHDNHTLFINGSYCAKVKNGAQLPYTTWNSSEYRETDSEMNITVAAISESTKSRLCSKMAVF